MTTDLSALVMTLIVILLVRPVHSIDRSKSATVTDCWASGNVHKLNGNSEQGSTKGMQISSHVFCQIIDFWTLIFCIMVRRHRRFGITCRFFSRVTDLQPIVSKCQNRHPVNCSYLCIYCCCWGSLKCPTHLYVMIDHFFLTFSLPKHLDMSHTLNLL